MPPGKWEWPRPRAPILNLALEETIYRRCPNCTGVALLWTNRESIIAGRNSLEGRDYSCQTASRLGVPVYRRFTGGGAVYHSPETLSVTIINKDRISPAKLNLRYAGLLASALKGIGLEARIANEGDIVVGGCKAGGSAGHIGRERHLYHAVVSYSLPGYVSALTPPRRDVLDRGVDPVKYRPCGLRGRVASRTVLLEAIIEALEKEGYRVYDLWNLGVRVDLLGDALNLAAYRARTPYWWPCRPL